MFVYTIHILPQLKYLKNNVQRQADPKNRFLPVKGIVSIGLIILLH